MKFDAYEYIGVIVPGSILIVALSVLFPDIVPALEGSLSLGDLGLILILAFVAGHLAQAGGNLFERLVWWPMGGMPTCWVAKEKTRLLSASQLARLDERLAHDLGVTRTALADGVGPIREIFVRIRRDGKTDRIDKFNRNYGLMRGVAVALIAAAILTAFVDCTQWRASLLLLALAGIATYRMVRFGSHYAREVFVEYLSIKPQAEEATGLDQSAAT